MASQLPKSFDILIEIKPDGTLDSTVTGVAGPDCEKLQELFDELGKEINHRRSGINKRVPPRP